MRVSLYMPLKKVLFIEVVLFLVVMKLDAY
jgi:hypothetical protein